MKVVVDFAKCTGLGICESMAPEFFEVNDEGQLELLKDGSPVDRVEPPAVRAWALGRYLYP